MRYELQSGAHSINASGTSGARSERNCAANGSPTATTRTGARAHAANAQHSDARSARSVWRSGIATIPAGIWAAATTTRQASVSITANAHIFGVTAGACTSSAKTNRRLRARLHNTTAQMNSERLGDESQSLALFFSARSIRNADIQSDRAAPLSLPATRQR